MAFSMFSAQTSPIAIDFGSSSVKLLQINRGGRSENSEAVDMAELHIPEDICADNDKRFEFVSEKLPGLLRSRRFKGKRAVCCIPSSQTVVLHMQVALADGVKKEDIIKSQLQMQLNAPPNGIVVRSTDVGEMNRRGQNKHEIICFAVAKPEVMRYVELLQKSRLEVVGVHADAKAMLWSFEHLNEVDSGQSTATLYVDLGWGGAKVAIGHGNQLVFAKSIHIGGRHMDQIVADILKCDPTSARMNRLSLSSQQSSEANRTPRQSDSGPAMLKVGMAKQDGGTVTANEPVATVSAPFGGGDSMSYPVPPGAGESVGGSEINFSELLDGLADELAMCLRYHQSLFPARGVNRAIFVGGEARQVDVCRYIARSVGIPTQLGDPIARLNTSGVKKCPDAAGDQPRPQWAVACGLCAAQAEQ